MQFHIIAVGNRMPSWVNSGFREYAKRMPPECPIVLKEIKPVERATGKSAPVMMAMERTRIESALPKEAYIIALDEHGKDITSLQLAQDLQAWRQDRHHIAFVIGGADGLDGDFKKNAHRLMRLSSLTMPHGMIRILLAEQLYRAWSITQNHPYHRS